MDSKTAQKAAKITHSLTILERDKEELSVMATSEKINLVLDLKRPHSSGGNLYFLTENKRLIEAVLSAAEKHCKLEISELEKKLSNL